MRAILYSLMMFAAASAASAQPTTKEPWIRLVPGQPNAAGYISLTSTANDALVSAESDCCARVEIHEIIMDGDAMQMRAVKEVPLPAGKEVTLAPMGYHIMLMGLKTQPEDGSAIPLKLSYASGFSETVAFTVKLVGGAHDDHKGHH